MHVRRGMHPPRCNEGLSGCDCDARLCSLRPDCVDTEGPSGCDAPVRPLRPRYRRIIDSIRRHMPDASVSTDIIVGFPGETEEQFERTVALIREVGFDRVNTAAYSPRPNTPAATWDNQVADLIKADRLNRLNQVVNEVRGRRPNALALAIAGVVAWEEGYYSSARDAKIGDFCTRRWLRSGRSGSWVRRWRCWWRGPTPSTPGR